MNRREGVYNRAPGEPEAVTFCPEKEPMTAQQKIVQIWAGWLPRYNRDMSKPHEKDVLSLLVDRFELMHLQKSLVSIQNVARAFTSAQQRLSATFLGKGEANKYPIL